jgi:hypothetical protein
MTSRPAALADCVSLVWLPSRKKNGDAQAAARN